MKKYVCPVCGYVHEGEMPEGFKCPLCGVPGEKFKVVEGEMALAAEHVFGVGAKLDGVPAEDKKFILDQLKANFNGECSEVGMYLCMARIAHREGYPEIGRHWEKAASEVPEHAAKFAGLPAIHDTVHEMARDEARHGRALEGLLKRYFG